MEHVVHLGINIDDESIARAIENDAKNQIIDRLSLAVEKEMGITRVSDSCRYGIRETFSYKAERAVDLVIARIAEDCRDKIIELAASKLAERAARQKWYRDAMTEKVKNCVDE